MVQKTNLNNPEEINYKYFKKYIINCKLKIGF